MCVCAYVHTYVLCKYIHTQVHAYMYICIGQDIESPRGAENSSAARETGPAASRRLASGGRDRSNAARFLR